MISIITPTIGIENLERLKASIRQQSIRQPFEHIIKVDKKREGAAVARNKALKKAKGEYIAFIDDDCVPDKYWLKDLIAFMDDNKDISACSGLVFPQKNANLIAKLNYFKSMSDEHASEIEEKGTTDVDHVSCTNSMWRKEALGKLDGFDGELKRSQDLDLGLRAKKAGMKMKAFNGAIVYHSYPSTLKESLRKSYIKGTGGIFILKKHPEFFGKRRYIIYAFPLYLLLFPILFPFPLLFCRSGFKIYRKEKSMKLFILATLLEYVKYHFNLIGIWRGLLK